MRRRRRRRQERLREGTRHRGPSPGGGGSGEGISPAQEEEEEEEAAAQEEEMAAGAVAAAATITTNSGHRRKMGPAAASPKPGKPWPRPPDSPLLPSRGWFRRAAPTAPSPPSWPPRATAGDPTPVTPRPPPPPTPRGTPRTHPHPPPQQGPPARPAAGPRAPPRSSSSRAARLTAETGQARRHLGSGGPARRQRRLQLRSHKSPGPGPEPGKADPEKSQRFLTRHSNGSCPLSMPSSRCQARRGISTCTLRSPGFSGSRGWGGRGERRGGVGAGRSRRASPLPQPTSLNEEHRGHADAAFHEDSPACPPRPPHTHESLVDSHPQGFTPRDASLWPRWEVHL